MGKNRSHTGLKKVFTILFLAGFLGLSTVFLLAYLKKDELIQKALSEYNSTIEGQLSIDEVRISPFVNFPYISIDLFHLKVSSNKSTDAEEILAIDDAYIGFDLLSIISGEYKVKKIKLSNGQINITQAYDGSINLLNALESKNIDGEIDPAGNDTTSFAVELNAIELENVDILKINEEDNLIAEVFIEEAQSSFISNAELVEAQLQTKVLFNLILDNDTTFLHNKHISINTGITYDLKNSFITLAPSELMIEKASFSTEGTLDLLNDQFLDLSFSGRKPNFDMFLALAPEELAPVLSRYDNGGQVYFDASVFGPISYGNIPHIDIEFGCSEAFIENTVVEKGVNDLFFKGYYTNGDLNSNSTSELTIKDIQARPETGLFKGEVSVKNFDSPDIQMQIDSEFNLDFLIDFFELKNLQDVSGKIALKMNFHDIIDIDNPEQAIERFNESYYTELKIEDLNFKSTDFHLPISDLNIDAYMDGHEANVGNFSFKMGSSDIKMKAKISDLPAIIHHTNLPVEVDLDLSSNLIDIYEISQAPGDSLGFNEQLSDLSLGLRFISSAKAFTESPNLPLGEFFIDRFNARFNNYPHALHDFHADVIIDTVDFKVIDFTGFIDQSDFHFDGKLKNYDLWFSEQPIGETEVDFNLTASRLQLNDLFSYGGENYVPEDYRNEEFDDVKIHGVSQLTFNKQLATINLQIDQIEAYMKEHDMRFEKFSGLFRVDSTRLRIKDFQGKLGNSEVDMDLTYYFDAEKVDRLHKFSLKSPRLDFDQLFSYMPAESNTEATPVDHEAGFNIFDLPFSNLNFRVKIDHLNYHKYLLDDFQLKGRMQKDHYLYVDTLALYTAGGAMRMEGYFNGSDPDHIYFSPNLYFEDIDLDKLLFKFDNFGQDQLISDNLHGQLTGQVTGKIQVHPDLVPMIDDSQLEMGVEVVNGSLVNFTAFEALSDFFTDKNLALVRFDTLKNDLRLENGDLIIPEMNLNTSLGYFEISGRQGIDLNMDYAMRIPVKVVAKAGFQKLFAKKDKDNSENVDEIQYRDFTKRTRFVNVTITGTPDDYDVGIGKSKKK
jgi:hypothetical protein